jgi:predicted nucleic acid-binding Zn ribbon protein
MGRPRPIANILSDLIASSGYARIQASGSLGEAWREAAGELLARQSRPGQVRRGVLEISVGNSTLAQEMSFHKPALLAKLAALVPDENIRDLRFRVGPID